MSRSGTLAYNPAVMASRIEPTDSLDFFPTPPWGTRALMEYVINNICEPKNMVAWEPAAGQGHMAEPLKEYFGLVHASDVHDYRRGYGVGSFVGSGPDCIEAPGEVDWIITNPPFRLGEEFVRTAMVKAKFGVAMLARTAFVESETRYPLFGTGFYALCPFAARLPMFKGEWKPTGSSATSYSWFVWTKQRCSISKVILIPPDAKRRCSRPEDIGRFAIEGPF